MIWLIILLGCYMMAASISISFFFLDLMVTDYPAFRGRSTLYLFRVAFLTGIGWPGVLLWFLFSQWMSKLWDWTTTKFDDLRNSD